MVLMSPVFIFGIKNQDPSKRGEMTAKTSKAFSDGPYEMRVMVYESSLSEDIRLPPVDQVPRLK